MAKCGFDGCTNEAGDTKLTGKISGIGECFAVELTICDDHAGIVLRGATTALSVGAQFVPASPT